MGKALDHVLDEMTEVIDADQTAIEARMERLERIVQLILLALVEGTKLPLDHPGEGDPPAGWQHMPAAAPPAMAAHGLRNC